MPNNLHSVLMIRPSSFRHNHETAKNNYFQNQNFNLNNNIVLKNALLEFAGCAVIISHDRWFLDRIATHILAFEGGSRVVWFEGNYDDYEKDWKRRLGPEADQPHRVKYKPLTKS